MSELKLDKLIDKIDGLETLIKASNKEWLTAEEAAAFIGYKNSRTVYNKYYKGELPGIKKNGRLLFNKKDLV